MKNYRNKLAALLAAVMVLVSLVSFSALAEQLNVMMVGKTNQTDTVQLITPWGEHALTCYGTEEGKWIIDGSTYTKRVLLADGANAAVYISEDNMKAVYAPNEAVEAMHMIKLAVNGQTDLMVKIGSAKVVIVAGKIVENEANLPFSEYRPVNAIADGSSTDDGKCTYLLETSEDVTIAPYQEGGEMNAQVTIEDYSAGLTGSAASMTLSYAGDILISGASNDISLQLALNKSAFDFVTVSGAANGDVAVCIKEGKLQVSGALANYTVENMTVRGKTSAATVPGDESVLFAMKTGKVAAYADRDGDSVFETKITE